MPKDEKKTATEKQMVVFSLGPEFFGIDISTVQEIVRMQNVTKLPNTPEFMEGVTNLRGKVIPVIDLRKRFGLAKQEVTNATRIIVVEVHGFIAGMIVDAVQEVLRVSSDQIDTLNEIKSEVSTEYLQGVAKVEDRLIVLLYLDKVWGLEEAKAMGQVG